MTARSMPPDCSLREVALTYFDLRKIVGLIGLTLPVALLVGGLLTSEHTIQPSISDYYHTSMRDWLQASLCVIGVFLLSYRYGIRHDWENRLTNVAGVATIGVAAFHKPLDTGTPGRHAVWVVHGVCGVALFVLLGVVSFFFFTDRGTPAELAGGAFHFYRACGLIIWASIPPAVVVNFAFSGLAGRVKLVFWCEAVAVFAFAISWLVKGYWSTPADLRLRSRS